MQDESKNNFDAQDSSMAKSKGMAGHGSYSRQSTFLQNNGAKVKILESDSDKTLKVAWNPKNHLLSFGGDNECAYLWDMDDNIANAKRVNSLPHLFDFSNSILQEKAMITAIDWNPDGTMFTTAATDGICRLWDAKGETNNFMFNESSMPLKMKEQHTGSYAGNGTNDSIQNNPIATSDIDSLYDCKWNKDGTAIVTVSEKNNVILWNTEGKIRASYQGHTEPVCGLDWKNNNVFATSSNDGIIKIWDVQSTSAVKTFNAHDGNVK